MAYVQSFKVLENPHILTVAYGSTVKNLIWRQQPYKHKWPQNVIATCSTYYFFTTDIPSQRALYIQ
jgi:hypothetical protein